MKHLMLILGLLLVLLSLVLTPQARAQQSAVMTGLVEGITGGTTNTLSGYALTAIGLNAQASTQTSILNQLTDIQNDLQSITTQLGDIEDAILTQTCDEELSSSSVTNALVSIQTVDDTYITLLQEGENTAGTVSAATINNFLNQVINGPGGDLPPIPAAINTINITLQETNNDGIIGTCEAAVTSLPETGSFGGDAIFYADPINLLQYFADYQTVATLLVTEYDHYEAFLTSPYYSSTTISNGLPANEAGMICTASNAADNCLAARNAIEETYVYLQNQYSVDGVPYSTKDSNGNLQTGLYLAGSGTNYLFAGSIEEFTNYEDIPQNNCPSVMTSSNGCGLAFRNDPSTSPFWDNLYNQTYQYETGWQPATAEMWRAVLNAFAGTSDKSSTTVADALTTLGFQNADNKIILTPTTYSADPKVPNSGGTLLPIPGATALCFIDTDLGRSFSLQPWCYNGSSDDVSYGDVGTTLWLWNTWDSGRCMTFRTIDTILNDTNDPGFYGADYQYDSYLNSDSGKPTSCPSGSWVNDLEPGWLIDNNLSGYGFFWPAIDVSNPACGTNLSFGLQAAVLRTPTNFRGVPTMCGADFDAYFSAIAPRNPFEQIAFTTAAVSGSGSNTASLGPITIELQDTSTGIVVPLNVTSATTVDLSSSSLTGVFSATQGGPSVTSVIIPAGSSSATFYYGDSTAGAPQITADPGNTVPGIQDETITSGTSSSDAVVVGNVQHAGSGKGNGKITIRGVLTVPAAILLQRATLSISQVLDEDDGVGELVGQANGLQLNLPLVLAVIAKSSGQDAVYETPPDASPRVRVEIVKGKHPADRGKFQISVDDVKISSPAACTGKTSITRLSTRLIGDDGIHPSVVFDGNLAWKCHRNGKLTTFRSKLS